MGNSEEVRGEIQKRAEKLQSYPKNWRLAVKETRDKENKEKENTPNSDKGA